MTEKIQVYDVQSRQTCFVRCCLKSITGVRPKFYEADVADKVAIFAENDIDAVIHFAGYKAVGESVQILKDAAFGDKEMSVVLLRYFNPIGAHESGMIGEKPNGIPNNLMPYITQVAAGIRDYLSVFGNDYPTHDGTGVRDYIHVVDLAKGHIAAYDYSKTTTGCEVVNLGTGVGFSVLDLVKAFEEANDIKISYEIAPRRSGDIATCYAGTEKAAKLLNWTAEKSIVDMCKDSWRWQQSKWAN